MKSHLLAFVAIAAVAGASVALSQAQRTQPSLGSPDTVVDGIVDSADLGYVAQHFGELVPTPGPCVPYQVFDGSVTPAATIINSLGEVITPRGGLFLISGDDPRWQSIRDGTAFPLVPC